MNEPLLFTEDICKSFDGREIIKNITISLNKGETVSLLGISGSGKTTVFNIVSGIMAPDSGEVYLNNEIITSKPGKISYMLQKDLLFEHKKIIDNVSLPLVIKGIPKKDARKKALELFETFGLQNTENQYPHALSGGMRQRAALLRTYLASDSVVLLDEPFSALDTVTKAGVHKWYITTASKLMLSTLLITHDIDEAILLSDRIYIISGSPAQISAELVIEVPHCNRSGFELTEQFIDYKRKIVENLGI